jgi:4-amino-4-deoxy-L-arabinose transferase-like glycosyltransferase
VPVGEAPDEAAHLAYVNYLLGRHALPPLATPPYGDRYESYQAPLEYMATALVASALGIHSAALSYQPNAGFSFFRQGSRAYLPGAGAGLLERRFRVLRIARLPWAALTAVLVFLTAHRLAGGRVGLALGAAIPFVLAPQFLFVSGTVNNDGAVTACAALAILALVHLLDAASPSPAVALLAGSAAGLAPFGKASGFLLFAPLGLVAVLLARRKAYRPAILLLAAAGALAALWFGLAEWRFGALLPPPPTGLRQGLGAGRELLHPHWIGALWVSFWGKFGWLNVRLPVASYLCFVLPSVLVVVGLLRRAGRLDEESPGKWRWLVAATLGANLVLIVVYLVRIDWQPQGRYLFPAMPALAGAAALGLRALAAHPRLGRHVRRELVALLVVAAVGMAILGIYVIVRAYA